jgi:Zn-dependent peptidase ImmA (M78 family)
VLEFLQSEWKMGFNPKELNHDEHGVPRIKFARLEEIAQELLTAHCPQVLASGRQTPVVDILEKLRDRTKLSYCWADLGFRGDSKVLGKVNFPTKTLFLDESLQDERKIQLRFTAAHEIGHWVLHRYRPLRLNQNQAVVEVVDDEGSLCRLESTTPRDWVEMQANAFAAALVLPKATFHKSLVNVQAEIGIIKNLGFVFKQSETNPDFVRTVAGLCDIYGVSKQSVKIRLRTLKMIEEEDMKSLKTVKESVKHALGGL